MAEWSELSPTDDGRVRLAVLGQAVEASLIPAMFSAACKHLNVDAELLSMDVIEEEFEPCVRHLAAVGFTGASVTHPHKVHAARIAERFWTVRHSLGVANVLSFQAGHIYAKNTEVSAFMATLAQMEPGTALVLGAGHNARSVVLGLMEAGWKVRAWSRTAMKTRVLQTLFKRYGEIELATQPDPSGCKLVVNATPAGVKIGDQPPLLWQYINRNAVVCDLVYRRVATEFLRNASNRGLKTIDGRELVVVQAAEALEAWLDKPAPREVMRQAIGLRAAPNPPGSPLA